ncbi:MAG TPA: N-acetyltransferase, partial [Sphingomonas sp.]
MAGAITISEVKTRADKKRYIDVAFRLNADDPHWVPPLKDEVMGLITPGKNPWFGHGHAAFFLATRDGIPVGRISAQIDDLLQIMPVEQGGGFGSGQWGMFEAEDAEVAAALIVRAEQWLRDEGMTRSMG